MQLGAERRATVDSSCDARAERPDRNNALPERLLRISRAVVVGASATMEALGIAPVAAQSPSADNHPNFRRGHAEQSAFTRTDVGALIHKIELNAVRFPQAFQGFVVTAGGHAGESDWTTGQLLWTASLCSRNEYLRPFALQCLCALDQFGGNDPDVLHFLVEHWDHPYPLFRDKVRGMLEKKWERNQKILHCWEENPSPGRALFLKDTLQCTREEAEKVLFAFLQQPELPDEQLIAFNKLVMSTTPRKKEATLKALEYENLSWPAIERCRDVFGKDITPNLGTILSADFSVSMSLTQEFRSRRAQKNAAHALMLMREDAVMAMPDLQKMLTHRLSQASLHDPSCAELAASGRYYAARALGGASRFTKEFSLRQDAQRTLCDALMHDSSEKVRYAAALGLALSPHEDPTASLAALQKTVEETTDMAVMSGCVDAILKIGGQKTLRQLLDGSCGKNRLFRVYAEERLPQTRED